MRLEATLLGTFQLYLNGMRVDAIEQPRLQSLLGYLLLNRTAPLPRQRVAYLFWPDKSEGAAYNNLRATLHKLRRLLPYADQLMKITPKTISWYEGVRFDVDVEHFADALARANSTTDSSRQPAPLIADLERAVDLYGGPLMASCYDDWVIELREEVRAGYVDALIRLTEEFERTRDYNRAIGMARKLIQLEPWRERTYRSLMRLLALTGEREAALRLYAQCVEVLDDELAVAPADETTALYQRLLAGEEMVDNVASLEAQGPLLVGRASAWRELSMLWQGVAIHGAHVALLDGEVGIGKSYLADALLDWAARQGFATARAQCFPVEQAMAYAPMLSWLRTPSILHNIASLPAAYQQQLARLLPELTERRRVTESSNTEAVSQRPASGRRRLLFEAVTHAIAENLGPVMLLLDDVQWCDQDTVNWLQFLLHQRPDVPVLLLLTLRSGDATLNPAFQEWQLQATANRQLTRLTLVRFSLSETGDLVRHAAKTDFDTHQIEALHRNTDGNPLFLTETLRQIGESAPRSDFPVPPAVHALISTRVASLSTESRVAAEMAAVIGRPFDSLLMVAAAPAELSIHAALEELWTRQILREREDGHFTFSHPLFAEVIYANLSPLNRRRLHRRVGEALTEVHSMDPEQAYGEAAHHFRLARSYDRSISLYAAAAEMASKLYAYHRAVTLYEQALDLAGRVNLSSDRLTRLYLGCGRMLEHGGRFKESVALYRTLETTARLRDDRRMESIAIERLVTCFVEPNDMHSWTDAQLLLQRGLQLARDLNDADLELGLLRAQMVGESHYGHDEAGRAAGLAAIEFARASGNDEQLGYLANDLATHLRLSGHAQEGQALAEEARRIFQTRTDFAMLADNLSQQAWADMHLLRLHEADNTMEQCEALCRQIDNGWNLSLVLLTRATRARMRGDLGEALRVYQESMAVGKAADLALAETMVPIQLGALLRMLGRWEEAEGLHLQALAAAEAMNPFLCKAIEAQLALDAFAVGKTNAGTRWLDSSLRREVRGAIGRAWLCLADVPCAAAAQAEATGAWAVGLAMADAALTETMARGLVYYLPTVHLLRGRALLHLDDPDGARAAYDTALRMAQEFDLALIGWQSLAGLAEYHDRMGEEAVAERFYRQAAALVQRVSRSLPDPQFVASFLGQAKIATLMQRAADVA